MMVMNWKVLFSISLTLFAKSSAKSINIEWTIPQSEEAKYKDTNVQVGDKVNFLWTEVFPHNVYIHPTGDCGQDNRVFVGNDLEDTSYIFKEEDVGDLFFACDIPGHCNAGQIIKFTVEPKAVTIDAGVESTESNEEIPDDSSGASHNAEFLVTTVAILLTLLS